MVCEACHDVGAIPSYNTVKERNEIQRCDLCQKFNSDKEAWLSLNPEISDSQIIDWLCDHAFSINLGIGKHIETVKVSSQDTCFRDLMIAVINKE